MSGYYADRLAAQRLQRVYQIAPPRIQQYLHAEVEYALGFIHLDDTVLDLGCGYGRIMPALAKKAGLIVGIDTSLASLVLAKELTFTLPNCRLACMNAVQLAFPDQAFNLTLCLQNGISAFHVDQMVLLQESVRVTRRGGTVLVSSYSPKIWEERLRWFRMQAAEGLLGKIDEEKTDNGVIVCKDGFTATTVSEQEFCKLTEGLDVEVRFTKVDESSLFCEMTKL
jgi:ubiquinone/menaquinone biosynthesis C-methylase UbiE